jgi:hypothetical protein
VRNADDPVMTLSIQGQLSSWYRFLIRVLHRRVQVALRVI